MIITEMKDDEWGLVLSGGGAKGPYEVGVWQFLKEIGLNITAISGTSVGALNAVLFATHSVEKVKEIWREEVDGFVFLGELGKSENAICNQKKIQDLLIKHGIEEKLNRTKILCIVNVYDKDSGHVTPCIVNKHEKKMEIILASAAIPIIYSTREIDGRRYSDPGFSILRESDNVPMRPLREKQYKKIIVVHLNHWDREKMGDLFKDESTEFLKQYNLISAVL